MKKEFSKFWKGSKQPRKQRKYSIKLPLHLKSKLISVNLSKDLREKQKTRNIPLRKGDKVKILRGKFKGKQGKVTEILLKNLKIYIEGIQTSKQDGSKVNVPIRASNLQILELNLEDKKRIKNKPTQEIKKEESKRKLSKETKK